MDLRQQSIDIIRAGQSPSGAYIASPTFTTYAYSWIRDGSFIAYAMDLVGEHDSSRAFHAWVANTVLRYRDREVLHCRFTLDGLEAEVEWPNYQVDGYGAWLWALDRHVEVSGQRPSDAQYAAGELSVGYIGRRWSLPCSDCWEEQPDQVHVSTLACLYGGLNASSRLFSLKRAADVADSIRTTVLDKGLIDGRLAKWLGGDGIDASLLWAATPFGLLDARDSRLQATLTEIEQKCVDASGGVHRYPGDTYYGGGAWLLLTAWLGWHYALLGRQSDARRCLEWVEARADERGMPEQVPESIASEDGLAAWTERWGKSAHPLLWSHAMHLILLSALG